MGQKNKAKAKSLLEKVQDQVTANAMRVIALPVDPVKLAEIIAREVCRQHGATYRGYRFRKNTGALEVSALGIMPDDKGGPAMIVGELPAGAMAWRDANEAP